MIEEIKQRKLTKALNLKQHEQKIQQQKINIMFEQGQRRVYQKPKGRERSEGVNFSAEENKRFWSGMKDLGRDREAGQLDEQRNEKNE